MEFAPDGRVFVAEKAGRLRVIKNGALLSTSFLTVSVDSFSERGLLGVAFDPSFATNRFVYVYYTRSTIPIKNRLSRFTASATNLDVAQTGSEVVLLDNIPSDAGNHNGGAIHFGRDGKLYVAIGDGGITHTNAQDLGSLSGKLLRLNPDGTIPFDNPFVSRAGARGEVWAYGLRNPFTFAVQPGTGTIFINDVGEASWEEINLGAAGANYGWPTCEGICSVPGMTNPIFTYPHSVGNAITGGTFYQGSQFPGYAGRYFFADYTANWVNVLDPANGNTLSSFGGNVPSPVDLKVGSDGSLYYLSIGDGAVYRVSFGSTITPTPTATPAPGSPQTVTFDDIPAFNTNKPLQFEYPTGVISWVEGQWWLNGPSGLFNTQSASLQSGVTSGS